MQRDRCSSLIDRYTEVVYQVAYQERGGGHKPWRRRTFKRNIQFHVLVHQSAEFQIKSIIVIHVAERR